MRKRMTAVVLVMVFIMMLVPNVALADTITVSGGEFDLSTAANGDIIRIDAGATVTLTGSRRVNIQCGSNVNLTLDNVTIDWSSTKAGTPINFSTGDNTLTLVGTSTLKGWQGKYTSIYVSERGTYGTYSRGNLTINGDGTLNTHGGNDKAGLYSSGRITIDSGTVNATFLSSLSTLGSDGISCKDLTVNGGDINAYASSGNTGAYCSSSFTIHDGKLWAHNAGSYGRGIFCRNVTVTGGEVSSSSPGNAGLGGGSGDLGTIDISGGTVTANGGGNYAGITGATINISGGTVTARGGSSGAGIGGGKDEDGGNINISGGTVTASSDYYGAGIGGGSGGSGGTIKISGDAVVEATGNDGAGIGGGQNADGGMIEITGGTVTAKSRSGAGIGGGKNGSGADIAISNNAKVYANSTSKENIEGTQETPVSIQDDALVFYYRTNQITYLDGSVTHIYYSSVTIDTDAGTINGYSVPEAWTDGSYDPHAAYLPAVTVSYDGNGSDGGTVPEDSNSYEAGDAVAVLLDKPTKTGYRFDGWSDGANTYDAGDTFEMPSNDVTLTAQWTAVDYTVSYDGSGNNGGTVPSDDTVYHYEDEVTVMMDEPTRTGYTFGGWSDGSHTFDSMDTFSMPADNVTLTAQWTAIEYTVSYDGNGNDGGSVPSDDAVYHYEDEVTVMMDEPTKTGYTFGGWSDGTNTYEAGDKFDMPADNVTLTAQWTAVDYTVSYDGSGNNGGTVPRDDTVYHYEDEVTVLSDEPTKTGYTFGGWSDGSKTYMADDMFEMPADNVTLTAQWTVVDYTVSYDGSGNDGGTVPNDDTVYHYEDEVTVMMDEPTKTGYTFGGWSDSTNTYEAGDTFTMSAGNITLTAQWTAVDYTVSYDGNGSDGGTVPSDDTVYHYEDEVTVLSDEPTKTGYIFGGWSDSMDTYMADDMFEMPAHNVTLTAQWNAIDYTVTYSGGTVQEYTYRYEDTVTVLSGKPTRTGYTFAGWSDGTTTYQAGDTFAMPARDVTFTAQWNRKRVSSVTINRSSATLAVGETVLIFAEVLPDDVIDARVTWASSDETVATVKENGQVAAVGEGRAEITATAGGIEDICIVTVDEARAATTLTPEAASATPDPTSASAGDAQTITITPNIVEEAGNTYIIEISVDELPAGTTSIRTADGATVVITEEDGVVRITVEKDDINEAGSIQLVAMDEEGLPLGTYRLQVTDQEFVVTMPDAQSAWNSFFSVLIWVIVGIIAAGAIIIVVILKKRKKN